jgi:hypothetical protein
MSVPLDLRPVEPPVVGKDLDEALLAYAEATVPGSADQVDIYERVERPDGLLVTVRFNQIDPRSRYETHQVTVLVRPAGSPLERALGEGPLAVVAAGPWYFVSGNVV